eukprot:gene5942-11290_t
MGDLNTKIGSGKDGKTVGQYGNGVGNERGDIWVQWCERNDMIITNTWFKEHPRRVYTWKSPGGLTRNQIDFITRNERFKGAVKQAKVYPGADCGSDHNSVVCAIQSKLKKVKKPKVEKAHDFKRLNDPGARLEYSTQVKNIFDRLIDEGDSHGTQ